MIISSQAMPSNCLKATAFILALQICAPAQANDSGFYIREQQRERCEADGGSYNYPNCTLPHSSSSAGSTIMGGLLATLIIGGGYLACRANGGCGASATSSLGE